MIQVTGYENRKPQLHERSAIIFFAWNTWFQIFEYARYKQRG